MSKGKMKTKDGRTLDVVATGVGIDGVRPRATFVGSDGRAYTLDDLVEVKLNFKRLGGGSAEPELREAA